MDRLALDLPKHKNGPGPGLLPDAVKGFFDIAERVMNGELSPAEARKAVRTLRAANADLERGGDRHAK